MRPASGLEKSSGSSQAGKWPPLSENVLPGEIADGLAVDERAGDLVVPLGVGVVACSPQGTIDTSGTSAGQRDAPSMSSQLGAPPQR
jgi:hypothetical protein